MKSIGLQFIRKTGEPGYTASMVFQMLQELDIQRRCSYEAIRKYCKKHSLFISLDELGVVSPTGRAKSKNYIPKSKLERVIEGLSIPATLDQLGTAATALGYDW